MAAPTYVGNADHDNSGAAVSWPASTQADDIGILFVETANQNVSVPAGWSEAPSSPQGTGTAGAAGSVRLHAFWRRATSAAEATVAVGNPGSHAKVRLLSFRGCETSGSPFDDNSDGDVVTTAATAVSIPGITTLVNECLVLAAVGNATDATNNQTTVASWANASLSGFTRITQGNTNVGVGGGFDIGAGEKTTAGVVSASTATLGTASKQALLVFALKPPSGGGGGTVTEGGIYVATGVKATAGATGATVAGMDTASVQALFTIALKPPAAPPANQPPVVAAIPAIIGAVDGVVTFPISYSDPEGDTVTFSLVDGDTSVPTGLEILEDEGSQDYHIEWTPTTADIGEWSFTLRATDGTNTVDTPVSITVQETADDTILSLAQALAARAQVDLESARALADQVEEQEQMNSKVLHDVRTLISELEESRDYVQEVIDQIEEENEPT